VSRLDDLTVALQAAVSRHGHGTVAAHVHDVLAGLAAPETTLLEVERPVLGVDGCRDGWVGVLLRPDRPPSVHHASTIAALVEQVRENAAVAVVAIDIPLGLPDAGIRQADVLARRELAGKGPSVFTTLTRAAYQASSYADAREANLRHTGGTHSASAQAWALRAKILDADTWVQSGPPVAVIEVHPELAFARMAGAPLLAGKRTPEGVQVRRTALRGVGLSAPGWFTGSPFAEDDLLDACAGAWSGWRYSVGRAECLPEPPEVFDDGIPAAIRV
jgi:predicted RNase H-like nuclease